MHQQSSGNPKDQPKPTLNSRALRLEHITLIRLLEVFANILIGIILLLLMVQVVGRYVLHTLPEWSSEEATLLFLMWMAAVGASLGSANNSHLVVDSLVKVFPKALQRVIEILVYIIVSIFLVVAFYVTAKLAWINRATLTPRLQIPMSLVQASIPFAMAVMLYYNVKYFVLSFRKESPHKER
jgi:C4-dicarboxylate transporter DctQ subunit